MSAQWVIPGWPETNQYFSCRLQQRIYHAQNSGWVREVFKGVHRNDNICALVGSGFEQAGLLNACSKRFLPCRCQNTLADVNTNHALCPFFCHFNGISSFAAAEVDDNFPSDLGEELIPPAEPRALTRSEGKLSSTSAATKEL